MKVNREDDEMFVGYSLPIAEVVARIADHRIDHRSCTRIIDETRLDYRRTGEDGEGSISMVRIVESGRTTDYGRNFDSRRSNARPPEPFRSTISICHFSLDSMRWYYLK